MLLSFSKIAELSNYLRFDEKRKVFKIIKIRLFIHYVYILVCFILEDSHSKSIKSCLFYLRMKCFFKGYELSLIYSLDLMVFVSYFGVESVSRILILCDWRVFFQSHHVNYRLFRASLYLKVCHPMFQKCYFTFFPAFILRKWINIDIYCSQFAFTYHLFKYNYKIV